ncbi:MAG: protein kinase, partial [Actinomycetota bacterium]|nr:protein kinase [Actinomycetota bacterium]
MPHPLPSMAGRILAGRYRVVRAIARGGMAEVWEGHDEVLARAVAIKILHPHLSDDQDFLERFRREAVAAARLAHPGIVATFDTGTDDGVAFIVMELVPGRTLRQAIEEGGPLAPAVAVRVAAEVADALDHAHRAGLVHRDVKPANILLVEHDGHTGPLLQVKVADFGIARQQAQGIRQLTATGAVVGTAKYLAPEQVVGRTPDARTDVYALGVVLYEMLCGRTPFQAETELATALQHVRSDPTPPGQFRPGLPPSLEGAVLRAMAKDPDDRYGSAAEFRTALLAVAGEDGSPAPGTPQVVRDGAQTDVMADAEEVANAEAVPVDGAGAGAASAGASSPLDGAVPHVVRDPTPPRGTAPVARGASGGRSWVPLA